MYTEEVPRLLPGGQYEVLGFGLELYVLDSNTVGLLSSENLYGAIALGYAWHCLPRVKSQPFLFEHISQRN